MTMNELALANAKKIEAAASDRLHELLRRHDYGDGAPLTESEMAELADLLFAADEDAEELVMESAWWWE